MSNQSQCVKKIPFQTNLFSHFLPSRPVLFCLYYHQASASRLGTSKKNSTNTLPLTHTLTHLCPPPPSRIRPSLLVAPSHLLHSSRILHRRATPQSRYLFCFTRLRGFPPSITDPLCLLLCFEPEPLFWLYAALGFALVPGT
ncbi:hypothetical protein CCHR01_14324 [Colletotrichum chrysophilum]|uniref:Uncharacterized protein n=1 Tax=Colletotrichum chrysophilum TaxID=1836956 RepID=A0AAD9EFM8_9PEZI|nr:hypothetical protein CCHR01_14324 [Colletotrichum chrysophilum]